MTLETRAARRSVGAGLLHEAAGAARRRLQGLQHRRLRSAHDLGACAISVKSGRRGFGRAAGSKHIFFNRVSLYERTGSVNPRPCHSIATSYRRSASSLYYARLRSVPRKASQIGIGKEPHGTVLHRCRAFALVRRRRLDLAPLPPPPPKKPLPPPPAPSTPYVCGGGGYSTLP